MLSSSINTSGCDYAFYQMHLWTKGDTCSDANEVAADCDDDVPPDENYTCEQ